jgi:rhamnosyltransferase
LSRLPNPHPQRVVAVVVTFHPSPELFARLLAAVTPQVDGVVIVDNTPGGAALPGMSSGATVIRNGENVGLASAQNQGMRLAAERGSTHVLLLDQDSLVAPDCVERLVEALRGLAGNGVRVGAVGPRVLDNRTGRAYSFKRFTFAGIRHAYCGADTQVIPTDFLIASGTLVPIDSLRAIGPMDEGFFIDRVDIDWCLRASAKGYGVYGVCAAQLRHEPGERAARVWLGRWREVALHSPERTYYMVRNSILLARKTYVPLRWAVNDFLWLAGVVLVSCVAAPRRLRRLRLVAKGIWDGLRRAQGPLKDGGSGDSATRSPRGSA